LGNDDSFSVNSVRKHIDENSLPSLFPCTRWYKMILKKTLIRFLAWFVMGMLNRMTTSFSLVTRLLQFGILFDHGLICLPSFLSCEDWTNWFDYWHVSKDKKSRMYSIFAATCWTLWRFKNNIAFNSHSMRNTPAKQCGVHWYNGPRIPDAGAKPITDATRIGSPDFLLCSITTTSSHDIIPITTYRPILSASSVAVCRTHVA
nr:RNA-directed DNA polymerase, eukaryota [Tanacetum cinerariifolium]